VKTAVIGAGPAGLLFCLIGKLLMGEAWTVHLHDKRAAYARTHRLRLAPEPYLAIADDLRSPVFDALVAMLREEHFSPEINRLEEHLSSALAELGVTKTVRDVRTLADLDLDGLDTIVAADSVHSTLRELVRGPIAPEVRTHERLARLRVTGDDLPERLGVVDQFRLAKLLGSVVDYRINRNGFAEVDLFLSEREHALVHALGASPKEPVPVTGAVLAGLEGTLLRAVVDHLARGGREVVLHSTFALEHVVMPRVSFEAEGKRVFLVGDAAASLPFFRGMACLASCAHALARAHATGRFEAYDDDVARIVRREIGIVRGRARSIRGLRELVRLSALLPFPIQSWWLSAARPPAEGKASPSLGFHVLIAAVAYALLALGLLHPWLALACVPAEATGGFVYRWTIALEPGPHRYVRRVWEVQIAAVLVAGVGLAALGRASWLAAAAWWPLGAFFAVGIYVFEGTVQRSLDRAKIA
jgi:2-polyprenyl-6-methoxyphenol hydroxylase-like FAD-dependent oxidoreductase